MGRTAAQELENIRQLEREVRQARRIMLALAVAGGVLVALATVTILPA